MSENVPHRKRLMFVDDEPLLLMGLRRSLHSMRNEWEMEFASNGQEALKVMEASPVDVIVSDMRMPGMDGAQLLNRVREVFPQTIRFALTGQADEQMLLKLVRPAHQYLAKPCDLEQLKGKLSQAFGLRELLRNPALQKTVSGLTRIPSLPSLYWELAKELRSPDPSTGRISRIMQQDMGMTAKILQFANSAYCGTRADVSDLDQAVRLLGLDTIQSLVLSIHIFTEFKSGAMDASEYEAQWKHSSETSRLAKAIAHSEGVNARFEDDCFTAGLLHDIGKLILASAAGDECRQVQRIAREKNVPVWRAERELIGCTHAEIGAYLLGIWGLPTTIVESVAWHSQPSESPITGCSPLAIVHAAASYHEQMHGYLPIDESEIDYKFLEKSGLAEREPEWRRICSEQLQKGNRSE